VSLEARGNSGFQAGNTMKQSSTASVRQQQFSQLWVPLYLSFLLAIYCDLGADSVELLLARVKKLNNLPEGECTLYM